MTYSYGHAAMAAEIQRGHLAEADLRRRRREARGSGSVVNNRGRRARHDKAAFCIRPINHDDEALLVAGFARLSDRSRRLRFLGLRNSLSSAELHDLTHVDHCDQEALVALSAGDGRGIGIAQYVRDSRDRRTAEIAITVIDDWHRRGVGTELMTRLIERAEDEGIDRLKALVADDNAGAINLLHRLNLDVAAIDHDGDATEYEITIAASTYRDSRNLELACS